MRFKVAFQSFAVLAPSFSVSLMERGLAITDIVRVINFLPVPACCTVNSSVTGCSSAG